MKYLFAISLIVLLLSCKKKELTFQLKGQVTDLSFNKGLDGAIISITEVGAAGTLATSPIVQGTVASDGSYDLSFKRNTVLKYIIEIKKANYFEIKQDILFDELSTEDPITKNYATTAKSWVKLTFINQAPSSASDQLRFIKQEGKVGCSECCTNDYRYVNGTKDSVFYCVNDANTVYSYLYYAVNPSGIGSMQATSIAFDTVEIIKYW